MQFSSLEFIAFVTISLVLYNIIPYSYRWLLLLLASFVFLASFSSFLAVYSTGYAIINYFIAILIFRSTKPQIKHSWYLFGIIINIGMLVFYKYTNFLLEVAFSIFKLANNEIETPFLNLLIPLGISFYTFQSIGYLIDIKRGTNPPEYNFGKFILFIIYFPKFISGPVERSNSLLPQLNKDLSWSNSLFNDGLLQLLWGFFKTIIIADRLALFVNTINSNLYDYSGFILVINFFAQFIYLYFNFSGYTDIVLGISKLFGIELSVNFERPLFATNISNYWKRWHISLTSWCNDYIFRRIIIKRLKWKTWASVYGVFITFLIIGFWHGANWNFIVLGLLQGIAINYEFFSKRVRIKYGRKIPGWLNLTLSRFVTFLFICASHVFFFSKDMKDSVYYFSNMFNNQLTDIHFEDFGMQSKNIIIVLLGLVIVFFSEYRDETKKKLIKGIILENRWLFIGVVIISLIILASMGTISDTGFIYTQF